MDHGHDEVADEEDGDDADDDGFHGMAGSECFTESGIKGTECEEAEGHGDVDEVGHGGGR